MAMIPTLASLYVGDLHQDVTDGMLFNAFSEFNTIASVRICRDFSTDRSLGYGYVNFMSPQDAIRAIDVKNHSTLNGKVIRVMWSHRDPDARRSGVGNVFVKNLSDSVDNMKLQEMFQNFGNILSCKVATSDDGKSKGYGFIQFESGNSANAAIEKLNGSTVEGKRLYVGKFVRKCDRAIPDHEAKYTNLYMKNLDTDVSEEVLKDKFSPYGKIVSLVISKDENGVSKGFGFVNFESPNDAKQAVEALNGSQLGSKVLYVARAQKKSEREEMLRRRFEEKKREQILKYQAANVYVKNIADDPLYVAIAQRKEERKAQLQLQYAQRLTGLAGTVIPGGYSPLYYPAPSFAPHIPAQPGMIYQSMGVRPGWRGNGFGNPYGTAVQPSPVHLVPNIIPRYQRQYRGRINNHVLPQAGGPTYAPPSQQHRTHSVAASKDSSNQQRSHVKYVPSGRSHEINKGSAVVQTGEGSDMLSSLLSAAPPQQQKRILGDRLYPLVAQLKTDSATKITGMLLEMDNSELLLLLDSPESLAAKVEEAFEVLQVSKGKVTNQDSLHPKLLSSGVVVN
ncbi:hypothetical protein ACJIZ3_021856 [Penstemon smallii]|uniref:PABP n=1 Tax=Penstemon smallii TaxID=265156 RepID=A0ABD3SMM6_9LAMI